MIFKRKKTWPILKKLIFVPLSLKTTGIIVAPPIMVQSKKCFPKSYFLCIANNEIAQNSKLKLKKFSFLCTF
jgi:hypothetical protein